MDVLVTEKEKERRTHVITVSLYNKLINTLRSIIWLSKSTCVGHFAYIYSFITECVTNNTSPPFHYEV